MKLTGWPYLLSSFAAALFFVCLLDVQIPWAAGDAAEPIWVEATGEALQGDLETPKEVMEKARRDGQSKAVEKAAGVFIRSHTIVSNSQLAEDMIYASTRGKIEKVEILREGWDPRDRNIYRVEMKALVRPVYPEKGEGLALKASLSKASLKEGEEVKIFYEANSDCFVYIFSVAADGSVTLLLPNRLYPENRAPAGTANIFPFDQRIRLEAKLLPGQTRAEEKIKMIATRKKENLIPLGFQEGVFKVYDARSTGMISDLVKKLNQLEPADWTEATLIYRLEK